MDRHAADQPANSTPEQAERLNRLVLGAAVALVFFGVVGFLAWRQTPYGNTKYAPGYSEKAFRSIRVGDTEASVVAKLGEPFAKHNYTLAIWHYTTARDQRRSHVVERVFAFDRETKRVVVAGGSAVWNFWD
jgi:outer membrane protein assembly factor BamE (lipoprotein component of BamABCDE complex)